MSVASSEPAPPVLVRIAPALAVAAGAGAMFALLALRDPRVGGSYGVCPSILFFGVACPGCGSLRALGAITRGDWADVVAYNPAIPLGLAMLAGLWVGWLRRLYLGVSRSWIAPGWILNTLAAGLVVYAVARNIPVFTPYLGPLAVP